MTTIPHQNNRLAKLSLKERIGYGLGDAGFNFYWAIIGSYLVFFYTDIFGISAAAAATMVTVTKIIDAFTDPAVGALADRTKTRWGKFRPYLLIGAIPMMAAGILTMTTPDLGETGKLIWAYATYALLMLCYTFLNIPYSALSGVLSADGRERNKINSTRFFFAYFSSIIVGAATPDIVAYFLTDEMRVPWVKALCSQIQSSDKSLVMAFSGLSFRHRQMMRDLARPCQFIHLAGPFDLILERMKKREHFMPPELLRSQFEALDSTDQEPDISPISIDSHLPDILESAEHVSKRFLAP